MIWDENGRGVYTSSYIDKNGNLHNVHKEKIRRSALLLQGRETGGDNVGGKSESWADPEFWTKAEQYGVWSQDEIDKWDKIGASPEAAIWDPDEGSHIMYDSFKMMSFGLADQMLMLIPNGAGAASKAITATSKLANASKAALNWTSKLGSASRAGQVLNNAAASLGIGFAYGRSNAYELFSKNLTEIESLLRGQSELDVRNKYNEDDAYKAQFDERVAQQTDSIVQQFLELNAEEIRNGDIVVDEEMLRQQAQTQAYQQVQEEEIQKQMAVRKDDPQFAELQ